MAVDKGPEGRLPGNLDDASSFPNLRAGLVAERRHCGRKTKARPGFPAGRAAPGHPPRVGRDQPLPAPDLLTPVTPPARGAGRRPERQPGASACPSLSVKHQRDHKDHKLIKRHLPTTLM
jgi:hypothetical protein